MRSQPPLAPAPTLASAPPAPRRLPLEALRGRLIELSGRGASATLTAAMGLVLDAQAAGEPVAWVLGADGSSFFPPDAVASGVDLAALVVIRPQSPVQALAAADQLLRSGGFDLVILDLAGDGAPRGLGSGSGPRSGSRVGAIEPGSLPLAAQTRFAALAQRHQTTLCCLTRKSDEAPSLGGLVSLRAACERRRTADGGFACRVRVLKDKRQGPGLSCEEPCRAPPGFAAGGPGVD